MADQVRSETARPTPYYEDGQVAIYHGDCREIMPALDQVDAVLVADGEADRG